jgi:hypothetical protein
MRGHAVVVAHEWPVVTEGVSDADRSGFDHVVLGGRRWWGVRDRP